MVFNVTFNNISVISWRSVLLVEETGGPRENHRPIASHWQTLSHNVVHTDLIEIQTHNISTDCIGSCKSNYNTITATTAPIVKVRIPVYKYISLITCSAKYLSMSSTLCVNSKSNISTSFKTSSMFISSLLTFKLGLAGGCASLSLALIGGDSWLFCLGTSEGSFISCLGTNASFGNLKSY